MEVVSTFKRSGSFQGAVRRRSSVLSQLHDVNTISTPSHVALSTATANTSPAPGSESAESMYTFSIQTQTNTFTHLQPLSLSPTQNHRHTHAHTHTHTLLHGTWTEVFLLYGCVPSGSLAARCVQCLLCSFLLILPLKQHPVLTGCAVLVWSGLVQIQPWSQARVCFWCWVLVSAGGSWLFSLCVRCPDRNVGFRNGEKDSCVKEQKEEVLSCNCLTRQGFPKVQGVNGSSSCTLVFFPVCERGQAWFLWLAPAVNASNVKEWCHFSFLKKKKQQQKNHNRIGLL